jgi:hypothetical protein
MPVWYGGERNGNVIDGLHTAASGRKKNRLTIKKTGTMKNADINT